MATLKELLKKGAPVAIAGVTLFGVEACQSASTATPAPIIEPSSSPVNVGDQLAQISAEVNALLEKQAGQNPGASAMPSVNPDALASAQPSVAPSAAPSFEAQPSTAPGTSNVSTMEAASQSGSGWALKGPDGQEMNVSLPQGFTPDARLVMGTNVKPGTVNSDLTTYADWEKALNTGRPVGDRLAGYNYDYNDFCPTADFQCNVQGDMYAWRLFQGENVTVPGIGELEGGAGRSVMVLFLNATPDVTAWDNGDNGLGQVTVERGFTATGRSFDANPYSPKFPEEESGLLGHWLFTQANGEPSKSYIGITNSPDNANQTLFAVVVKNQWGNNTDGTPRYQFQLVDAGLATFNNSGKNVSIAR